MACRNLVGGSGELRLTVGAAYLNAAIEDSDGDAAALGEIAQAQGMWDVAERAGLGGKVRTKRSPQTAIQRCLPSIGWGRY